MEQTYNIEETLPEDESHDDFDWEKELSNIIFRLQSHTEYDDNEDIASGIEEGMSRAAEMLENLLRRANGG